MSRKIAIIVINQETCSFNSISITLEDFKFTRFQHGEAVGNIVAEDGVPCSFVPS